MIDRSTDISRALQMRRDGVGLQSKQRGFFLNPFRFNGGVSGQTVLLFNFTAADGSTSFTDESGAAGGFTASGNAQVNSNQLLLDGNGDRIQRTGGASSLFGFGTGDFTIEWFSTKSANGVSGFDIVLDSSGDTGGSGTGGYFIENSASRGFGLGRAGSYTQFTATNPNDSTQHWYAISRTGGTLTAHIDSTRVYNASVAGSFPQAAAFCLGSVSGANVFPFNGRINAIRVINGTGLYPTATTPPSLPLTVY